MYEEVRNLEKNARNDETDLDHKWKTPKEYKQGRLH